MELLHGPASSGVCWLGEVSTPWMNESFKHDYVSWRVLEWRVAGIVVSCAFEVWRLDCYLAPGARETLRAVESSAQNVGTCLNSSCSLDCHVCHWAVTGQIASFTFAS